VAAGEEKGLGDLGFPGKAKGSFREFVTWLIERLEGMDLTGLREIAPLDLYSWAENAPLSLEELTEHLSEFSGIPYVRHLDEEDADFRTLSRAHHSPRAAPRSSPGVTHDPEAVLIGCAGGWRDDFRGLPTHGSPRR
jgi:hypothetical protein